MFYKLKQILRKFSINSLSNYIRHWRASRTIRSLIPNTLLELERIEKTVDTCVSEDAPIFFFWWSGKSIPLIPQICFNRIKKMAGSHPVYFIDKNNIKDVAPQIPDSIFMLLENKIITIQYFSDILRTNLLYWNGGIWVDATIWPCFSIDKIISMAPNFYSGRRRTSEVGNFFVSRGRWTGYFISTYAKHPLMKFICDGLIEAAINYNGVVNYFTIDYLFDIAYKKSKFIRNQIKSIPILPNRFGSIIPIIDKVVTSHFFKNQIVSFPFYKLDWRFSDSPLEIGADKTMLGYLIMEDEKER